MPCASMSALSYCSVFTFQNSHGLQGHMIKIGKIGAKVIRETYQVSVKKPLGTCQGSLVRRPETVSTGNPLEAITKLTTMLQRRSRRPRSALSRHVHEVLKLCMAKKLKQDNEVPHFLTNKSAFMSQEEVFLAVGSELVDYVYQTRTREANPEGTADQIWAEPV